MITAYRLFDRFLPAIYDINSSERLMKNHGETDVNISLNYLYGPQAKIPRSLYCVPTWCARYMYVTRLCYLV